MFVLAALLVVLTAFGIAQGRFFLRRRRLRKMSWEELVARVQPVNLDGISTIAENFLHPCKEQLRIEPDEMWQMVGKLKGLQALRCNADAMLELAQFASRWNVTEGRIVSEMIRRDGVRLKRAVTQIEMALFWQLGVVFAPFQLQEAAAAYHLMRGRLLGLYQVAHVGLYPRLSDVL